MELNGLKDAKVIYLVIGSGISCFDSLEVAQDYLISERAFVESAYILKRLLFTKEIYYGNKSVSYSEGRKASVL